MAQRKKSKRQKALYSSSHYCNEWSVRHRLICYLAYLLLLPGDDQPFVHGRKTVAASKFIVTAFLLNVGNIDAVANL